MKDSDIRVPDLLELLSDQIELLYWNHKADSDPQLLGFCEGLVKTSRDAAKSSA